MLLVMTVCSATAQPLDNPAKADDADDDYATTPMTLAEILPKGGLDAVQVRYGFVSNPKAMLPEGAEELGLDPSADPVFFNYVLRGQAGVLHVITQRGLGESAQGPRSNHRRVYSSQGRLVSVYEQLRQRPLAEEDLISSETIGVVVNGEMIKMTYDDTWTEVEGKEAAVEAAPFDTTSRREVYSAKPILGTIPIDWEALFYRYHLERGHDRFVCRFSNIDDTMQRVWEFRVIVLGSEKVSRDDKPYNVTRLRVTQQVLSVKGLPIDPAEMSPTVRTLTMLSDGTLLTMKREGKDLMGWQFHTPEQLAKQFALTLGRGKEPGTIDTGRLEAKPAEGR